MPPRTNTYVNPAWVGNEKLDQNKRRRGTEPSKSFNHWEYLQLKGLVHAYTYDGVTTLYRQSEGRLYASKLNKKAALYKGNFVMPAAECVSNANVPFIIPPRPKRMGKTPIQPSRAHKPKINTGNNLKFANGKRIEVLVAGKMYKVESDKATASVLLREFCSATGTAENPPTMVSDSFAKPTVELDAEKGHPKEKSVKLYEKDSISDNVVEPETSKPSAIKEE